MIDFACLTFQGHPRSKVIALNESPYMISYMSVIQTKSLSLIVFEIIIENLWHDLSRSVVIFVNQALRWLPIVIMTDDLNELFFKIRTDKCMLLLVWPFKVIQGQRSQHKMKAHIWFPICLYYKPCLYLSWFLRYLPKTCGMTFQGQRSYLQIKA